MVQRSFARQQQIHTADSYMYVRNTMETPCYVSITTTMPPAHHIVIQGVSKRDLQFRKLREIYTEDIHVVLNCQNVAKHRVLPRIVIRNLVPPPSPLRQSPMGNTAAITTITMHMTK
jgi:hypothetical protein